MNAPLGFLQALIDHRELLLKNWFVLENMIIAVAIVGTIELSAALLCALDISNKLKGSGSW